MSSEKVLSLLFLRKDNKVLLAMKKRGFGAGRWNGVGGKVEAGETVEQAMIRESQEEIGITPTTYKKVADITFDEYFNGEPTLMSVHVYTATIWEGEPMESEEMKPQWFHLSDIPYDTMWTDDSYWLPHILEDKTLSAHFKLNQADDIIDHTITILTEEPAS